MHLVLWRCKAVNIFDEKTKKQRKQLSAPQVGQLPTRLDGTGPSPPLPSVSGKSHFCTRPQTCWGEPSSFAFLLRGTKNIDNHTWLQVGCLMEPLKGVETPPPAPNPHQWVFCTSCLPCPLPLFCPWLLLGRLLCFNPRECISFPNYFPCWELSCLAVSNPNFPLL